VVTSKESVDQLPDAGTHRPAHPSGFGTGEERNGDSKGPETPAQQGFSATRAVGRKAYAQDQALGPESAQISAAIRSCSAFGAFCGSPWPP
jgi:hypothetical protein